MSEVVPGAGGVVLDTAGRVLLIRYPPARGGTWTFPKGHIEPGESPEAAAVREVQEECAVRAAVLRPLGNTEYLNSQGVRRFVHWFAMRAAVGEPRPEPGFEARYAAPGDALSLLSHEEDRRLLTSLLAGGSA